VDCALSSSKSSKKFFWPIFTALTALQAYKCANFTCKNETVCYDPLLGTINANSAPLNRMIAACGGIPDWRSFTSGKTQNLSNVCAQSCCDSIYENYPKGCVGSSLFADWEASLITAQELACSNFKCNTLGTNAFSLCCGLSFGASVGIIAAIVLGIVLALIIVVIAVKCVRQQDKFF